MVWISTHDSQCGSNFVETLPRAAPTIPTHRFLLGPGLYPRVKTSTFPEHYGSDPRSSLLRSPMIRYASSIPATSPRSNSMRGLHHPRSRLRSVPTETLKFRGTKIDRTMTTSLGFRRTARTVAVGSRQLGVARKNPRLRQKRMRPHESKGHFFFRGLRRVSRLHWQAFDDYEQYSTSDLPPTQRIKQQEETNRESEGATKGERARG